MFRKDLELPLDSDTRKVKNSKLQAIKNNYLESRKFFEKNIIFIEKVIPDDNKLGLWYFLWGLSAWFTEDGEMAISLFKRSLKYDPELKESLYNISLIYSSLGKQYESKMFLKKYYQSLK